MCCQLGCAVIDPPGISLRAPVHGSTSTNVQRTCLTSEWATIRMVTVTEQAAPGWQLVTGVTTTPSTNPALRGATAATGLGAVERRVGLWVGVGLRDAWDGDSDGAAACRGCDTATAVASTRRVTAVAAHRCCERGR